MKKLVKINYILGKPLIPVGTVMLCMLTFFIGGCSITKNLPEGEVLYMGDKIKIKDTTQTVVAKIAKNEVKAALHKQPSTKFLGFLPIPVKMWFYTGFVHHQKGLGKWIFNHFAANPPVFISTVNPELRVKVATNLLHDYGYFNGTVNYHTIVDPKDSLKAKIRYNVNMKNPFFIDTLYYEGFNKRMETIIQRGRRRTLLTSGEQFNITDLNAERDRVSTLLRNLGYYYFRPSYMTYQADTLLHPGHVSLRLIPVAGVPAAAQRPYYIGDVSVNLYGKGGEVPNDSMMYNGMKIRYYKKLRVRPNMLYRWMNYQAFVHNDSLRNSLRSRLYSQYRQQRVQERLAQLNIFRYLDLQYIPKDTLASCDTLNVTMQATFDKPLDAQLDLNLTAKSNDQTGPGASFAVTRYNVFGGGETWNVKLKGSYEWQTGGGKKSSLMNSWEMGVSSALTFPRVVFPTFGKREYDFPASTTFRLSIDQLNRAKYYKLLAFGGDATYDFQPKRTSHHSLTPFSLTFNLLQHQTEEFVQLTDSNPALYQSLRNQFIPSMAYTYTYDNAAVRGRRNPIWWQVGVTSAGNLTSCIYRAFGQPFDREGKKLFGVPFAQFLRVSGEYRYTWLLKGNMSIASRVAAGVVWSYGNMTTAPYSEQFYIGGANSIRAFTARSIGPGGYRPKNTKNAFLDQTGDIRFEANVEYRFPIVGHLQGAVFLDAGNVWLLRNDPNRPHAQLRLKTFPKQVALGTGAGLRYDLDFIILRLDCGVALHDPYDTGRKGYYNVTGSFWKSLAWHFAIGYPF